MTALTGFQFTNLLPYILQVVPTVTGYYSWTLVQFPVQSRTKGGSESTGGVLVVNSTEQEPEIVGLPLSHKPP
ncbi:hypothetical protein DSO57_1000533 [Entomophthora muscae]|uniref:Uncharacterized protein n=1 Tax=Entomophthora muscae TaxID=34485 RepID=A0ACC2RP68_9FUNG|nr:hypothetical protein DSO57_1000533 [Entomophthora muscae]